MKTINIVVGDGDPMSLKRTIGDLNTFKDMEVVGATGDGMELIHEIHTKHPQIVLMGLMLKHIDGFGVLDAIRDMEGIRPRTLILSNTNRDYWMAQAFMMGASYYMLKPANRAQLCRRIRLLAEEYEQEEVAEQRHASFEFESETKLRMTAMRLLTSLGFTSNVKGYHYLVDILIKAMLSKNALASLTKEMYPEIACKYQTSAACVERAMRTAIHTAWKREGFNRYFAEHQMTNIIKKKPSISTLISFARDELCR